MKKFDLKVLTDAMKDFSLEKRVFANESQFQFELGQKLRDAGYEVLFEVLSIDRSDTEKPKKIYTDIVVSLGEERYVAIELKYKMVGRPGSKPKGYDPDNNMFVYADAKGINQYVSPQGAIDEGSHSFLCDVERLERLKNRDIIFNLSDKKEIVQAYAIIIANARESSKDAYWKDHGGCIWGEFSLNKGRKIEKAKLKAKKDYEDKYKTIHLSGPYICDWTDYFKSDKTDYPMKYMIFEIN